MRSVKNNEHTIIIKNSRFICYIYQVETIEEISVEQPKRRRAAVMKEEKEEIKEEAKEENEEVPQKRVRKAVQKKK